MKTKRALIFIVVCLLIVAGTIFFTSPKPEPFQLIYQEGPRAWYLDTHSIKLKHENTGVPYLDVHVKIEYEYTSNVDWLYMYVRSEERQWQPIAAIDCDKAGQVLEICTLGDETVSWRPIIPGSLEEKIYDAAIKYARANKLF